MNWHVQLASGKLVGASPGLSEDASQNDFNQLVQFALWAPLGSSLSADGVQVALEPANALVINRP